MYGDRVTALETVFNRKFKFIFLNKGETFFLALSQKWGETP